MYGRVISKICKRFNAIISFFSVRQQIQRALRPARNGKTNEGVVFLKKGKKRAFSNSYKHIYTSAVGSTTPPGNEYMI